MIITNRRELSGTARDASGPGWESVRIAGEIRRHGLFDDRYNRLARSAESDAALQEPRGGLLLRLGAGRRSQSWRPASATRSSPGVLYAPNAHDRHQVRVIGAEPLKLVCTFSPASGGGRGASGGRQLCGAMSDLA